jgi:hypothetical protein
LFSPTEEGETWNDEPAFRALGWRDIAVALNDDSSQNV